LGVNSRYCYFLGFKLVNILFEFSRGLLTRGKRIAFNFMIKRGVGCVNFKIEFIVAYAFSAYIFKTIFNMHIDAVARAIVKIIKKGYFGLNAAIHWCLDIIFF